MPGGRRRHRRTRRAPSPEASSSFPPAPSTFTSRCDREAAVMQSSAKKTCFASVSTPFSICGPQGWADLPDCLLYSIITLFSSFCDLLAFAATCHPWRAAIYSRLSTFTFTFPPLLLYPDAYSNYAPPRQWLLADPANTTLSFSCLAHERNLKSMGFLGGSYGHLIYSFHTRCRLVDVFTGTEVMPPLIPSIHGCELTYGTLVAPIASPKSHLLVSNRFCLFQWQVGSNSWSEHPLDGIINIRQIVVFKGEIFAMDDLRRLFTIYLVPHLHMNELTVVWDEALLQIYSLEPWLVVCGDMLLLVNYSVTSPIRPAALEVFRLDLSAEPAVWAKVEKLEKWALFVSNDRRSPAFACMSPERWGGNSGRIYHACSSELWIVSLLGHTTQLTETSLRQYFNHGGDSSVRMAPRWVFPSMFSFASQ